MLTSFLLTSAICYQLNLHGTFIGISHESYVHISTFSKMSAISPIFQAATLGGFYRAYVYLLVV